MMYGVVSGEGVGGAKSAGCRWQASHLWRSGRARCVATAQPRPHRSPVRCRSPLKLQGRPSIKLRKGLETTTVMHFRSGM